MGGPTIYVARHGERRDFVDPEWYMTAENPHDPPLTDTGKEQATELGQKLSSLNIRHVFASPFWRCVNTASNAAAAISPNLRVCIEPGLCEWLNAQWYSDTEGGPRWRTVESLASEFSNVESSYNSVFPMTFNFEGFPEPFEKVTTRCDKTYRAVLERFQTDGNILFVGHGSSVESMINVLVPEAPEEPITYCCLTECMPTEVSFKYALGMHCDTSFMTNPESKKDTRFVSSSAIDDAVG